MDEQQASGVDPIEPRQAPPVEGETTLPVEKRQGLEYQLFSIGELIPLKGVWFTIKSVTNEGVLLEPKGFTGKAAKHVARAILKRNMEARDAKVSAPKEITEQKA